jgi:acyl carrier protein
MVPSVYVKVKEMPKTANGKIDRKGLPEVEEERPDIDQPFIAPQTRLEQAIASVWREVLHLDKVGIDDKFFDIGGHSLLLARAHGKLQAATGSEILMLELFQYPTIRSLAEYLSSQKSIHSSLLQSDRTEEKLKSGKDRLKQRFGKRQMAASD